MTLDNKCVGVELHPLKPLMALALVELYNRLHPKLEEQVSHMGKEVYKMSEGCNNCRYKIEFGDEYYCIREE